MEAWRKRAQALKFECLRCGECCRNMYVKTNSRLDGAGTWFTLSLFLLPHETKLFPPSLIVPMWGAGLKGKARPRPEIIFAYQITDSTCPNLRADNLCVIYNERPFACRAFPVEVGFLDRRCRWVAKHFEEGEFTKKSGLELGDMPKYHDMLFKYISSYVKQYIYMWAFDIKTRKWVRTKW